MPPLEWNGFAGPVISIIILTTSVMNFTGLPWELLVEIMVSHFSAMKRFSLYEGLRRQQSPHYFINLPKYVQACDAELGVTGQVRWHWGFAALVSPRTFFFFLLMLKLHSQCSSKAEFLTKTSFHSLHGIQRIETYMSNILSHLQKYWDFLTLNEQSEAVDGKITSCRR